MNLIRPRQLVEGFWLRKVSDVYDMADGGTGGGWPRGPSGVQTSTFYPLADWSPITIPGNYRQLISRYMNPGIHQSTGILEYNYIIKGAGAPVPPTPGSNRFK